MEIFEACCLCLWSLKVLLFDSSRNFNYQFIISPHLNIDILFSLEFEQTPGGCVQWVCDCFQSQHFSVCIFHLQINHRSNEHSPPNHQLLDASFAIKSASFIHNRHSRCIKAALGLNPGSNEMSGKMKNSRLKSGCGQRKIPQSGDAARRRRRRNALCLLYPALGCSFLSAAPRSKWAHTNKMHPFAHATGGNWVRSIRGSCHAAGDFSLRIFFFATILVASDFQPLLLGLVYFFRPSPIK